MTVLVVDNDLGFAFWLGQALDRAGYESWPALSVAAALSLIGEVRLEVHLLVINAMLPSAAAFVVHLTSSRPELAVMLVFEGPEAPAQAFPEACVAYRKPQTIDTKAENEWVEFVKGVLTVRAGHR